MISRIYVSPKTIDPRAQIHQKSWNAIDIKGKIKNVQILDSYLIRHDLPQENISKIGGALSNSVLVN
jgi:hypothetical protein